MFVIYRGTFDRASDLFSHHLAKGPVIARFNYRRPQTHSRDEDIQFLVAAVHKLPVAPTLKSNIFSSLHPSDGATWRHPSLVTAHRRSKHTKSIVDYYRQHSSAAFGCRAHSSDLHRREQIKERFMASITWPGDGVAGIHATTNSQGC
jgi:hypothetical protein